MVRKATVLVKRPLPMISSDMSRRRSQPKRELIKLKKMSAAKGQKQVTVAPLVMIRNQMMLVLLSRQTLSCHLPLMRKMTRTLRNSWSRRTSGTWSRWRSCSRRCPAFNFYPGRPLTRWRRSWWWETQTINLSWIIHLQALEGCPYRVKYFARVWLERRDRCV